MALLHGLHGDRFDKQHCVGGEHSYKNVQLACFMCNCKKGNRVIDGGEQLRMFG